MNVLKKYFHKEDIWLIPNVLCYLRVLLTIVFIVLYTVPFSIAGNPMAHVYLSAGVLAVSAYTDFLDGFIARKFDMSSGTGKIIDPISDKLSQFGIALALAISLHQFLSLIILLLFYVAKDVWMFFTVIAMAKKNRSFGGAKWYGKVSTFLTYVVLGALLVAGPYILKVFPLGESEGFFYAHLIIDGMSTLALSSNVLAFIMYFIASVKLLHGKGSAEIDYAEEDKHAENL